MSKMNKSINNTLFCVIQISIKTKLQVSENLTLLSSRMVGCKSGSYIETYMFIYTCM